MPREVGVLHTGILQAYPIWVFFFITTKPHCLFWATRSLPDQSKVVLVEDRWRWLASAANREEIRLASHGG